MAQKKSASRGKPAAFSPRKREQPERFSKAVEALERAVKAFHKGDVDRARGLFEGLVSDFPTETELTDRARAYVEICVRQKKSRFSPKSFEELVAYGVFCHNQGEFSQAIKYLSKAVEMEPKSDHAHYCLAAAYSRKGDHKDAARHLKQAVSGDDYNRVLARSDEDFEPLRADAEVARLLQPTG